MKLLISVSAFELFHCYSKCYFRSLAKGICIFRYHTKITFSTKSTLPWMDKCITMWRHIFLFSKRIRFKFVLFQGFLIKLQLHLESQIWTNLLSFRFTKF